LAGHTIFDAQLLGVHFTNDFKSGGFVLSVFQLIVVTICIVFLVGMFIAVCLGHARRGDFFQAVFVASGILSTIFRHFADWFGGIEIIFLILSVREVMAWSKSRRTDPAAGATKMEQDDIPNWVKALSRTPLVRAYVRRMSKNWGPHYCDRCSQLLGDRSYLIVKTRFFFWTEQVTSLCPQCHEREMTRLQQSGALPPQA
jgi:hypothetical protein